MTIAQAFNEIAAAQGGTPNNSGTIAGAIDALNDALAGSDQEQVETIEQAVRLLGSHIGGGSSVTVEALTATENKTYTAPEGKAYSPVTVNVSGGGATEYNITCMVNYELSQSVVYPAKATDGKWEKDGNTALDSAQAGQMLIVPKEYINEGIFYYTEPMPEYPDSVPTSNSPQVSKDTESAVFVMPAHAIGVTVTTVE